MHYGHELDPDDILEVWLEELSKKFVELEVLRKKGAICESDEALLEILDKKLKSMSYNKLKWQQKNDIMHSLNRKALAPQRRTVLSKGEEQHRCKLTWMEFDEIMDKVCFRLEALKEMVDDPAEWMDHIEDLVFEFEDEIGFWIGLKGHKVAVDMERFKQALARKRLHSKNVKDHEAIKQLEEGEGGGLVQVRGTMAKGADKHRITIMPRLLLKSVVQGVKNAARKPPKGSLAKTLMVVPGVHCNLDFIDCTGEKPVWNRDWDIEVAGKPAVTIKAKALMELCSPG